MLSVNYPLLLKTRILSTSSDSCRKIFAWFLQEEPVRFDSEKSALINTLVWLEQRTLNTAGRYPSQIALSMMLGSVETNRFAIVSLAFVN